MPSSWIERRPGKTGTRYRVEYRLGGRESTSRYGGSFRTMREARARRDWIAGELASMRVPSVELIAPPPVRYPTVHEVADAWRASRVDVAAGTATTYAVNLARLLPILGDRAACEVSAGDVAALVAELAGRGLARESIRKTLTTLAQVLDFADVSPNPVRAKAVKLPHDDAEEVNPPTADHVVAAFWAIARTFRLPVLLLDATGMRVGELERLRWGDVDEREGRWRVSRARTKTRQARWVSVPEGLRQAVTEAVPREDRDLDGQVLAGFGADRFRTALVRACRTAGVPAFSPHDLRHRRATLWHLSGVPVAEAANRLGHSAQEHLKTYAHVVLDRSEIDYSELLGEARVVPPWVPPRLMKTRD